MPIQYTCPVCGKTFFRPPSAKALYCSRRCMWPNRRFKGPQPLRRGIYAIVHRATGRAYIGSTENLRYRLWQHRWLLNHQRSDHRPLQEAWDTFGSDAFDFRVLEELPAEHSLFPREQAWLDQRRQDAGVFNTQPLAGTPRGLKRPDVAARKGIANSNGKLSDQDVTDILSRLDRGETGRSIAHTYGIGQSTVSRIRRGHRVASSGGAG